MSFDSLWHQHDDFILTEPKPRLCPFAEQFSLWAEALFSKATHNASVVSVNQAKLLLVDRYMDWRAAVPGAHRNLGGSRSGHVCIFQVFEETYQKLKTVELSLTPPMLFLPPPPSPPPPPPQIAGIFFGEKE
jgi:hypothetical protein